MSVTMTNNSWYVNSSWDAFSTKVVNEYEGLDINGLRIYYVDNLSNIRSLESVLIQERFFEDTKNSLQNFERSELSSTQQIEYDLIQYFSELHLERIALEKRWTQIKPKKLSLEGLAAVPMGKEWYVHFLHRWVDLEVNPEDLFDFGMEEIKKVKQRINQIQEKSKLSDKDFKDYIDSDTFYIKDPQEIKAAFEIFDHDINKNLPKYFPDFKTVPPVTIEEGDISDMAQVPGFYRNNTFFYNHFGRPFNKRQIKWLYMHEANPGHHYEVNYRHKVIKTELQNLFSSPGYGEGWAAYIEEIGYEIEAYDNIYDELGKWEWDLIRSVRVPLDVGLNFYGWSDQQALEFWEAHIENQDIIGLREIARMKKWPCQVITYKYGANKILAWKEKLMAKDNLSLLEFHTKILQYGPLPYSILEKYTLEDVN
jgi:uncharacterized protein (DUF885 family)